MPSSFPSCPRTVSWLGRVAPLAGTTLCRFSNYGTPGPCDCLRAYQLPKTWGVPSMATPPRCSRGRLAPRAPSPGAHAHDTAHAAIGAPGPASCGPTRAHYAIPAPPWALGLPRPTSPVPGVPTKRYSPFAATLPARQQGSCTPPNGFRAYILTNSKTTSISVNLTNPVTHITLTPGYLGWESLLPPITHRTMHTTFAPFTQARWPSLTHQVPFPLQLISSLPSLNTAIPLH